MQADALAADALIARASEETGLDDFGDSSFETGLARLVDDLHGEARLSQLGRAVAEGQLLSLLRTRLTTTAWVNAHPEVDDERIDQPIFLVGLSRSGTTALSHILSCDPANRALLAWEANDPAPPPAPGSRAVDPRAIAARDAGPTLVEQLNPAFTAIHHDPWDMPVECIVVLNQHFFSLGLSVQYFVPGYTRWLVDADHAPAYRWHHLVLRLLQSGGDRGRWQLKSPQHALAIEALAQEHPGARFVVTHRDPVECVASTASLACSLSGTFCESVPPEDVGRLWCENLAVMAERTMAARERLGQHRFVDIAYRDVKADPVGAVEKLYSGLGDALSPEADAAMRAHAAIAVPNRHGRHDYDLAAYGLDRSAVEDRFAAYRERFAEHL